MRYLLLAFLVLLCIGAHAQEINGFVNDYAEVLAPAQEAELESILKTLYEQKTAEYAVVTINSLEGRDIEGYAYDLAEGKLGEEDKNNGLLLLVAVKDRKYRFEVGRGLEPILPDITVGRIGRQYLVPNFKEQNYSQGIIEASRAVQATLSGNNESSYFVSGESAPINLFEGLSMAMTLLIALTIIVLFIVAITRKAKSMKGETSDYFIAAWALGQMMGKGRSGGFGGGFGGFGGGSFGGGGASGGW